MAVGLAAAALPQEQRLRAIVAGLVMAVILRIGFALVTVQLLAIVGLLLAGGILLLWVCWKMWRDLRQQSVQDQARALSELHLASSPEHGTAPSPETPGLRRKTFGAALLQIMVADVTMSLDNVLAVAGAAREHPLIMVMGLTVSIGLMGIGATYIARLLGHHRWIGYVGLVIVLYVAMNMIWDGGRSVAVRTDGIDTFNRFVPSLFQITAEDAEEYLRETGTRPDPEAAVRDMPSARNGGLPSSPDTPPAGRELAPGPSP